VRALSESSAPTPNTLIRTHPPPDTARLSSHCNLSLQEHVNRNSSGNSFESLSTGNTDNDITDKSPEKSTQPSSSSASPSPSPSPPPNVDASQGQNKGTGKGKRRRRDDDDEEEEEEEEADDDGSGGHGVSTYLRTGG